VTIAALIPWLPIAAAVLLTVVGLAAAYGRWPPMAAVLVCGLLVIAAAAWQQQQNRKGVGDLAGLSARLAETTGEPAPPTPDLILRRAADALAELDMRNRQLDERIAKLQQEGRGRAIGEETAAKLAEQLRRSGSRRVVVSCVPGDIEAYLYANQLVDILKQAGWDAHGPETTELYGTAPDMAVGFYIGGAGVPEAANVLNDAFAKFDIPHHSKIAPSEAIPDPDTVELFVPPKPPAAPATATSGG
jgi:hypothetical protein